MKFFLISDNIDTLMGMRLSGIEGVVVHEKHEVKSALNQALSDSEIEFEILLSAINSGKKIDRKEKRPSWKVFKQFCEIENV